MLLIRTMCRASLPPFVTRAVWRVFAMFAVCAFSACGDAPNERTPVAPSNEKAVIGLKTGDFCKGCEICAERCPTGAISMVAEDTPVSELGAVP